MSEPADPFRDYSDLFVGDGGDVEGVFLATKEQVYAEAVRLGLINAEAEKTIASLRAQLKDIGEHWDDIIGEVKAAVIYSEWESDARKLQEFLNYMESIDFWGDEEKKNE